MDIHLPDMHCRVLQRADIPAAQRLVQEAGWNQLAADWALMLEAGHAVGVFHREKTLIATALALPFAGEFGWISMVLVTKHWQRQGIAGHLLDYCLEFLRHAGKTAMLDATEAGRKVYLPRGYRDIYPLSRMWLATEDRHCTPVAETIVPIPAGALDIVAGWDHAAFGADRSFILAHLRGRLPEAALVMRGPDGGILGYCLGRDGRNATQLGPVVAGDATTAQHLIEAALSRLSGPVTIDVADHHTDMIAWLRDKGFARQRGFMRMAHAHTEPFDDKARIFAISGPELA